MCSGKLLLMMCSGIVVQWACVFLVVADELITVVAVFGNMLLHLCAITWLLFSVAVGSCFIPLLCIVGMVHT